MLTITSRENPQIKQVCALTSSSKKRRKEGLFVCEGFTLLEEALRRGSADDMTVLVADLSAFDA